MLASCENFYIDQNLGGSDFTPTDVRNIDYTLTDADYKAVVSNKVNKELSRQEGNDSLAFDRIAKEFAFSAQAPAELYLPAFLATNFPQLNKGSLFNITYKNAEGAPAYLKDFAVTTKYTLSTEDYDAIWGEGKTGTYYLTPATMMQLTSVLPTEAEEGAILAVVYDYKDTEPVFGKVEEDEEEEVTDFFAGNGETRGFYTPAEAIAAVDAGDFVVGDSIKVGGIISRWFRKSSAFDKYHSVSFFVMDPVTGQEHEFEFYNCYTLDKDSFETFEYTDEMNAICIDRAGREFHLGDTVVGAGTYTIYNGVHELNTNCYLTEWRPVSAAPAAIAPKQAAAANGKKTVLYQYNGTKWVTYKNEAATVVAIPEDVYSAVGFTYLLDKNKDIMTSFLAQEFPYAQAGKAYTVVYVATKAGAYNAIEFVYDGTAFVENLGVSLATSTFSLSDVWGSTIYYKQAIAGDADQGKLVIQDVITDPALSFIWQFTSNYGMKATAYIAPTNYESESWVVTPAIDLSRAKMPQLSFDQARRYGVDFIQECFVMVSTDYAGDVTKCTWTHIPFNQDADGAYIVPDGSSWNFMSTGEMDLTEWAGQQVHIGFKYTSSTAGSATWEFKNLLVSEPAN